MPQPKDKDWLNGYKNNGKIHFAESLCTTFTRAHSLLEKVNFDTHLCILSHLVFDNLMNKP